jgi:sugar phosphate isomerase/epimerase
LAAIKLSLAIQTPECEQTLPVALLSGSFTEKLHKAAMYGADGVELMTANPGNLPVEEILSALKRWGLQVAAVASGGLTFVSGLTLLHADPDKAAMAQQRFQELIDLAARLHAGVVTIGSFRGRASQANGDGSARLAEILYRFAETASQRGIKLALEPLNRYESDLINNHHEGLAFIQQVNHPALGLLLDTFHVNIEESSWTEPFSRVMAAGRLFHVHLGDNNRLPPGDGLIDFAAVVSTLQQGGYHGYLSAELLPRPDPDTAAKRTIAYMRTVMS